MFFLYCCGKKLYYADFTNKDVLIDTEVCSHILKDGDLYFKTGYII